MTKEATVREFAAHGYIWRKAPGEGRYELCCRLTNAELFGPADFVTLRAWIEFQEWANENRGPFVDYSRPDEEAVEWMEHDRARGIIWTPQRLAYIRAAYRPTSVTNRQRS